MEYITATRRRGCVLCEKPRLKADTRHYILSRERESFVILNAFPYSYAHLLVCPYLHRRSLDRLPDAVLCDLMRTTTRALRALKAAVKPDGFNIGVNQERVAGAGIAGHVHIHIIPRWRGDTNFMLFLADVRVIPQHLDATYRRLLPHFRTARTSR